MSCDTCGANNTRMGLCNDGGAHYKNGRFIMPAAPGTERLTLEERVRRLEMKLDELL